MSTYRPLPSVTSLIAVAPLHAAVGPSAAYIVPSATSSPPASSSSSMRHASGRSRQTQQQDVPSGYEGWQQQQQQQLQQQESSSLSSVPSSHVPSSLHLQSSLAASGTRTLEQICERDKLRELSETNRKLAQSQRVFADESRSLVDRIPPPIQPPSRFPRKSFIADQFFSGGSSAVRSELGHTYYRQQRPLQGRLSTFYPNATTESGYPFHMFAF